MYLSLWTGLLVMLALWAASVFAVVRGIQLASHKRHNVPTWQIFAAWILVLIGVAGLYVGWRAGTNAMP